MDWETARRWLEIMAKNVFDPNQPAYIVVLQRVEELEAALKLGAEAYVAALPDASTDAMTDLTIERNALRHENERLREALGRVLTEAGLQAHKHGCANKIARPAQWDARLPCAGCQAESALQGR